METYYDKEERKAAAMIGCWVYAMAICSVLGAICAVAHYVKDHMIIVQ
jgi:hypothetical protein